MAKITNSILLKQQQKMTAAQIQVMNLIQLPAIALEARIKEELEDNPLLEEDEKSEETLEELNNQNEEALNDIDDYLQDDELLPYRLHQEQPEKRSMANVFVAWEGFCEDLLSQLGLQNITNEQSVIGREIIGNLDSSGYLSRSVDAICDDLLFRYNMEISVAEVENVLKLIQTFEPAGIAARNLRECLLLQIERINDRNKDTLLAKKILTSLFSAFTSKHYQVIMQRLKCNESELQTAISKITSLNPKPANALPELTDKITIAPDYILWMTDGRIEFSLNNFNTHNLHLNSFYQNMLSKILSQGRNKANGETVKFIRSKADSAKTFISALAQREDTLQRTMQAIIDFQEAYFIDGDIEKLKPMRLVDVAEKASLDVSTISRVVSNKYVQTHFGIFGLKEFFSYSMLNEQGEAVATEQIRALLSQSIDCEDKLNPLTDQQLVAILKSKGLPIARRTVAKYREAMKIPVARLRKEIRSS